jgi:hypothetical protein
MRAKNLVWIFCLTLVASFALVAQAADHTYIGAKKCKMCHKVQHTSWLETTHAKATEHAKASTDREFTADCLECHATNSDEALAGVQCEACHGPGSDYKGMKVMKDQAASVAAGLVIPSQATCDTCHNGEDHATKKVLADEAANPKAIHAHKK